MALQGQNTQITPMGITRNTPPQTARDGEMDELINMRYKDGAWRPTPARKIILSGITYTQVHVHAGPGYKHYLGISDGKLYYFADDVAGDLVPKETPVELAEITSGNISVIGNVVVLMETSPEEALTSDIIFEEYDNTNGKFYFDGVEVPATGATYVVNRNSMHNVTAETSHSWYVAQLGSNQQHVELPYAFIAGSESVLLSPVIAIAQVTLKFTAYDPSKVVYALDGVTIPAVGSTYYVDYNSQHTITATVMDDNYLPILAMEGDAVNLPFEFTATGQNISFVPGHVLAPGKVLVFEAYDTDNGVFYLDGVAIPAAGAVYPVNTGVSYTISCIPNEWYTPSLAVNNTAVSLPYQLTITADTTTCTPSFTEKPYTLIHFSSLNSNQGGFFFNGSLIPTLGFTYKVHRNSVNQITAFANPGYFAALEVDDAVVQLPYQLTAVKGQYFCTTGIGALPQQIITIRINPYAETFGTVFIRINDNTIPVSPAGRSFSLNQGTPFYIYTDEVAPGYSSTFMSGGIVLGGQYYEDVATNNMTFDVVFYQTQVTPNKYTVTVSPYDSMKGSISVHSPGQAYYSVPATGGSYQFEEGSRVYFTVSPLQGFELNTLMINGLAVPLSFNSYDTYIYNNLTAAVTFKAAAPPPAESYYLEIYDPGFNTNIYVNGVLLNGFEFDEYLPGGSIVTVHLVPKEGFVIDYIHERLENVRITQNPFTLSIDKARSIISKTVPKPTGTLYTRYVHYPIKT